jgi:hypothetical protein
MEEKKLLKLEKTVKLLKPKNVYAQRSSGVFFLNTDYQQAEWNMLLQLMWTKYNIYKGRKIPLVVYTFR